MDKNHSRLLFDNISNSLKQERRAPKCEEEDLRQDRSFATFQFVE
ncbi:hypothetical protein I7I51_01995 [Histoplasma capsulatum]|uniref:Uncharacterized protein n=1 Tax=Ajellomyces capsulatus TaxID=5037 RepID=A0A8A1MIG7_AJECA|nr:hypothetical protein I7I51_01995 [Histoplasma capsulatum]